MKRLIGIASVASALLAAPAISGAAAPDHGVVTLWCKGTATDNDDPRGRDEATRTTEKQGKLSIDFDASKLDFLSWNRIAISELTFNRIRADQNALASGRGHHVRIDRTTGEISFQTLVHDPASGDTWYSHSFSGRCTRTDKHGHPAKQKSDNTGF
jgi:hypothetical protein